jgi:hypothetical protein
MTTPTKQMILEKATELFHIDRARANDPSFDITPTEQELKENGHWQCAISELMMDRSKHEVERFESYIRATENFAEKQTLSEVPFDFPEAMSTGFFVSGTSQSGKTNLAKLLTAKLLNHGVSVYVLDVSRAWTQETPIENFITVPHNGTETSFRPFESAILDLNALSFDERFRFVNAFIQTVYDIHKSYGYKRAPYEFIFCEESQTYWPNGCFRSTKKYAPAIDLVTVGANFNLRFGLITQFPAMVDKAPVKISQQRYFGWTTEKNDLDYIQKFIGKEWLSEIKSLQKGEFLCQLRNKVTKFQCRKFGIATANDESGFSYQMCYAV